MLCVTVRWPGEGAGGGKPENPAVAEPADTSSSDDNDGGDESRYRITAPLEMSTVTSGPTPALLARPSHPRMPLLHSSPHPALPVSLPVGPGQHVVAGSAQLSLHPSATVATRPVDLMSLPPPVIVNQATSCYPYQMQQPQQSILPVSTPRATVVRPPRCRDYDGECNYYVCWCLAYFVTVVLIVYSNVCFEDDEY